MTETFEPTDENIQWARAVLSVLADGGILIYPATTLRYEVSKPEKTLTLLNAEVLEHAVAATIHRKSICVFDEIGYLILS